MPRLPGRGLSRFRPQIVLPEIVALIVIISVIALSGASSALWLVGVVVVALHTLLFYRLGRISERSRSGGTPDFFRGLKQGLLGRIDPDDL